MCRSLRRGFQPPASSLSGADAYSSCSGRCVGRTAPRGTDTEHLGSQRYRCTQAERYGIRPLQPQGRGIRCPARANALRLASTYLNTAAFTGGAVEQYPDGGPFVLRTIVLLPTPQNRPRPS